MEYLGWIANTGFAFGGLLKNPRHSMALYCLSDALYIVVYLLMGLHLAAISIGVATFRTFLSLFLNERYNRYSTTALTLLAMILLIANMNQSTDLLVVLAALAIGLSCSFRDNYVAFKLLTMSSQILWSTHSVLFEVYPMLVCCLVIFCTNAGSLLYFFYKEKFQQQETVRLMKRA